MGGWVGAGVIWCWGRWGAVEEFLLAEGGVAQDATWLKEKEGNSSCTVDEEEGALGSQITPQRGKEEGRACHSAPLLVVACLRQRVRVAVLIQTNYEPGKG